MTEAFVEEFLAGFDDSRFPADFLQRYEPLECLSHNALGETLLVKDFHNGARCVAKCYPIQSLPLHTVESGLLKELRHPGLPASIGEYRNEHMCCVVRAYVPGRPLDQLACETALTPQQSVAIVTQLCEILAYLHGQTPPVIHRDIKPQNVVVDAQGHVTLIDFGISRTYDETSQEDTLCLGTRRYAAPEQYGFSQSDSRSDVYALGVLLCWLLTGKTNVNLAPKAIPDRRLAKVVAKCTAFAPQDRYQNAIQVRNALTGQTARRGALALVGALLILLTAAFFWTYTVEIRPRRPAGVAFQEPLIESAVRLALAQEAPQAITEQDLLRVRRLYVFGDKAAADQAAFDAYAQDFANNGGSLVRGSIHTLDDLTMLKNLQSAALVYQNITDLTPMAQLATLEEIDLRHNPLDDVTPLAQIPSLRSLSLFDTNVSDLTALSNCTRLISLDIGYTRVASLAALDGLNSLQTLNVRRTPLQSLEYVETHPLLVHLMLSETQLLDLSPLLALPRLEMVEVDEAMRPAAEAVAEQAQFRIVYP